MTKEGRMGKSEAMRKRTIGAVLLAMAAAIFVVIALISLIPQIPQISALQQVAEGEVPIWINFAIIALVAFVVIVAIGITLLMKGEGE